VPALFLLAEPAVLAVLQERMKNRRTGDGQAVEVVEQDDPAPRRRDQPRAVLPCVSEGAATVAEQDAAQERLVGQLVARGDRHRRLAAVAGRVEEGRQPALAGAALAVHQDAGQGPPRTRRGLRRGRGLGAQQAGQVEELREGRAEGVGLIHHALLGDRRGEGGDGGVGQVPRRRLDGHLGQAGGLVPLAHEAVVGESVGLRIGGIEQPLDFRVDAGDLLDEQVPRALAAGVVGESQVRHHDGEELLVEELPRQVEPAAALAHEVQVGVVGRPVAIRGEPLALVAVGADLQVDRPVSPGLARPDGLADAGVLAEPLGQVLHEARHERFEHAGVVVEDHEMRNPGHRRDLAGRASRVVCTDPIYPRCAGTAIAIRPAASRLNRARGS